jgi:DNA-binding response OmpR family regulator
MTTPVQSRVLIVEDHDDVSRVVAMLLAGEGHVVEVAPTANHALVAMETFAPNVVLIDIALPDIAGDQLASKLRVRQDVLRIVAMTGTKSEVDRSLFDAWLTKPFTLEQLVRAVRGAP